MFEFMKAKDQANTAKRFSSLLLSMMVHAGILGLIVTAPLIFCNTLPILTWTIPGAIALPSQAAATSHQPSAHPGQHPGSGGNRHALIKTATITAPGSTPDFIDLKPSAEAWNGDGKEGLGMGIGTVIGGGGDEGTGGNGGIPELIAGFKRNEKTTLPTPLAPKKMLVQRGGDVQASQLIRKVQPIYPELARRAHVEGTVTLMAFIDEDGNVENLQVVSGHLLLRDAALQAVRQWKYSPTVLNGEPVSVQATVNIIFKLQQ
jgi:periplasmic protein TonB